MHPGRRTGIATPGGTLLLLCLFACSACQSRSGLSDKPIVDEAQAAGKTENDFRADGFDYFAEMDTAVDPYGPDDAYARPAPLRLTADEIKGRNTWMLWTGGNEAFWDWLANHSYGFVDLLKLVDFNPQRQWFRFKDAGLIVEPNTRTPAKADQYGLYIREPVDKAAPQPSEEIFGRSSGIVGLRLYRNPFFDAAAAKRWNAVRYYSDPTYYLDPTLVRPYRVGLACAFCHVGPHPLNPPDNVEEPKWTNLSATIGSQYLRTRMVFGNLLEPNSYFYHVLDSQQPGALDASLIASDNINNANTENAIWELGGRLDRAGMFEHRMNPNEYEREYRSRYSTNPMERVNNAAARLPVWTYDSPGAYANPRPVPRVLLDGSDSIGPWTALARVYLNIGMYHQRWVTLHNPLFGYRPQKPFKLDDAKKGSTYWRATENMMEDVAKYLLRASWPMRLRDAPGGKAHVKGAGVPWAPELKAGRQVFASRCIVCHSSKQPPLFDETADTNVLHLLDDERYKAWAKSEVERREFWTENYLSTDRRLPVSLIKTNAGRALASNSIASDVWEDFSSEDYKRLPPGDAIKVWNPFRGEAEWMTMPGGGRGYYRPASLVSVWATAPLLHNNSVGIFNNDPSVEGRYRAFCDAIQKLLTMGRSEDEAARNRWERGSDLQKADLYRLREDHGLIWRLPQDVWIRIPASQIAYFVASTFDVPRLVERFWLAPVTIAVLAFLCLISRRRLFRRTGYVLTVVASALTVAALFLGGYLLDLNIGPIPRGLPVDVVANIDARKLLKDGYLAGAERLLRALWLMHQIEELRANSANKAAIEADVSGKVNELGSLLHAVSKSPDYVMDRGHYFAASLTPQEQQDLIDLLLTF
jgi:hypothetical protein